VEGIGRHVVVGGTIYEGQISKYLMHGYGRHILTNGDYYIGNFTNGKRNGEGKLYNKSNIKVHDGKWVNDKFEGGDMANKSPGKKSLPKRIQATVDKLHTSKGTVTKSNNEQQPSTEKQPFQSSFAKK
jgi:hypothetical protein